MLLFVIFSLFGFLCDGFVIENGLSRGFPSTQKTRRISLSNDVSLNAISTATEQEQATGGDNVSAPEVEMIKFPSKEASGDWELDCYSRPVSNKGSKLWELLITDSTGSFRYCKTLLSNQVNSKSLRSIVDSVIDEAEVKPKVIRFFRKPMYNMISIALSGLDDEAVSFQASRCVFSLAEWLEERHKTVYPKMPGYRKEMMQTRKTIFDETKTPSKLPDALRGEKYAFVGLPLAEFLPGGGVNSETIGIGKLCPVPAEGLPADAFVQGIVVLTDRAPTLSQWLSGVEVAGITCDLKNRNMLLDVSLDTECLMAKLNDEQRKEGLIFEQGKDEMAGLHFLSVQKDENHDPAGFWLFRTLPKEI